MIHLTPAMQKFVLHWGEMGDKWGVNRSVAQIYALLYCLQRCSDWICAQRDPQNSPQ